MQIGNFRLLLTCGACPEQYDVFLNDKEVGYLRLRHGAFSADYTFEDFDERVFYAYPRGDGIFEDSERFYYLKKAIEALERRHFENQSAQVRGPWDQYEN